MQRVQKQFVFLFLFTVNSLLCTAQHNSYVENLKSYQKDYVAQHEVVKQDEQKYFRFFDVSEKYRVKATFSPVQDMKGFIMKTSGSESQHFFRYGKLKFILNGKAISLTLYRSEALMNDTSYQDYVFLPFTDLTSGEESYGGGRYLDFRMGEIKNNRLIIDFNKAYNP